MGRVVTSETDNLSSSFKTGSVTENAPQGMPDDEVESSVSNSVTSGEVALQMKLLTDPLTRQLE